MSRKPRIDLIGFPMHVVQRGNDRRRCFLDDEDRRTYLRRLQHCADRFGVGVHAYVLMDNHVHLLATPSTLGAMSRLMQSLGSTYVRDFNERHARTGTLWEGRFRACLVGSDEYFWNCHRYIERNPVRASLVTWPGRYEWSSFACNALGRPDAVVTPHPQYQLLGATPLERGAAYRRFFDESLGADNLDALRECTLREGAFGAEEFVRGVEAMSGRLCSPRPKGRPRKNWAGP